MMVTIFQTLNKNFYQLSKTDDAYDPYSHPHPISTIKFLPLFNLSGITIFITLMDNHDFIGLLHMSKNKECTIKEYVVNTQYPWIHANYVSM